MSRFDMNLLGALDALLNERNVTRAAGLIGVTQPTMSGMLQRLRYQLDDELLVRNGRGMELTQYAQSLIEPVRTALLRVGALLKSEERFDPGTSKRTFSIMTSDYCTSIFMGSLISHLARLAPGVQLVVEPLNEPFEKLMSGEIDLGITADGGLSFGPEGAVDLPSLPLFSDEFVCIVDDAHPLGPDASLEEVFAFPHVAVHVPGVAATIGLAAMRQQIPSYEPAYLVADFSLVPNIVVGTQLVGLVQRRLAEAASRSLPIRSFRPPFDVPRVNEELRWHPRHFEDPGHIWLRNTVCAVAAEFLVDATAPRLEEGVRPERGTKRPLLSRVPTRPRGAALKRGTGHAVSSRADTALV